MVEVQRGIIKIPKGLISFVRSNAEARKTIEHWQDCDGTNGTPDLTWAASKDGAFMCAMRDIEVKIDPNMWKGVVGSKGQ